MRAPPRKFRCAWVALQPSLDLQRWAVALDKTRIAAHFIGVGADESSIAVDDMMSFAVPADAWAIADLLQRLELDAAIVGGMNMLATVLPAARRIGLPVFIAGAGRAEEASLAQLLPSLFVDAAQRRHFVALPDAGNSRAARLSEARRSHFRAKLDARLSDRRDAWTALAAAFPAFAQEAMLRSARESGYRVQPSGNITSVAAHTYRVAFDQDRRIGVATLVAMIEFPETAGRLCLDLIDPAGQIAATAETPLARRPALGALRLDFPPIEAKAGSIWELRVRLAECHHPVRLAEMHRFRWGGWKVDRLPFVNFEEPTPSG